MDIIAVLWNYILPFLFVLGLLVFVHEFGHYWVARRCGVKVESFSIGFGQEIWSTTDAHGTRWRIAVIPLGGYVKMFGDGDVTSSRPAQAQASAAAEGAGEAAEGNASAAEAGGPAEEFAPDGMRVRPMTEEEKAVSFHHKPLAQRTAIVAAGPVANFLFSIVVLTGLFMTEGQPFTPPVLTGVIEDSAAAEAGFEPGDRVLSVNSWSIQRFEDIAQAVRLNPEQQLRIRVERGGEIITLDAQPRVEVITDPNGNEMKIGFLGIQGNARELQRHGPFTAIWQATRETYNLGKGTLVAIGQMFTGARDADELSGPLRIAQMSGDFAQSGLVSLIMFMALLSVNLGLINLFPVPMLDGGHLLFYAVEAVRGKPVSEPVQEVAYRVGLAAVLTLFIFATWNDLVHLQVVQFFAGLVS